MSAGSITGYVLYNNAKNNAPNTKFTTTTVKLGTISTTVSASGTVSNSAQIDLTPSSSGTLTALNVKEGDAITIGEVLGVVTDPTSAATIQAGKSGVNTQTQTLNKLISSRASLYTKAAIGGRIKNVNISVGDDVTQSKTLGSLMVISSDGKMKTTAINYDPTKVTVALNDSVNVSINGSVVATGTVSNVSTNQGSSSMVVTTPDTFPVGATVTISKSGTTIGIGTLSVNAPVEVQGPASGTISNVYVSENTIVSKGSNLFKIDGTELEEYLRKTEKLEL